LVLALVTIAVACAFQGSRGLYETTEGRYAEVAREMVSSGDWVTPRLDGEAHWTKPPLTYWAIAAGLSLFGKNAWGARAFNIIAFAGVVLATCGIGGRLWGRETGYLAALIAAVSPFMVVGMNSVSTDMLLALWETAAVYFFLSARGARGSGGAWRVNAMWALFGLAFLTKGPPGLLPLLSIAVFAFVERRRGHTMPRLSRVEGIAAFLVIGFGWYALVVLRDHALAGYFLGVEVWGRVATGVHHRNPQWYKPLVIYLPPLLLGLGLWLFDAFVLAPRARRAWAQRGGWRWLASSSPWLFVVLWIALPLAVLSISHSRLPLYVLPFMPAVALGVARVVIVLRGGESALRRGLRLAVAGAVLCIALKGVASVVPSAKNMAQLYHAIAADERARVVTVDLDEMYGLDFYLGGTLDRVRAAGLGGVLGPVDGEQIIVVRRGHPVGVDRLCAERGLDCREDVTSSRYYSIWRVQPGS
jgi:4-amino-4-deoxy-L-arabinose transferase